MEHYYKAAVDVDDDVTAIQHPNAVHDARRPHYETDVFMRLISHEFNTRLNAIIGFSEILKGAITDPTLRHYVDVIRSSGDMLLSLVHNNIDGSTIDRGVQGKTALCVRQKNHNNISDARTGHIIAADDVGRQMPQCLGLTRDESVIQTALMNARMQWDTLIAHGTFESVHNAVFAVDDNEDNLTIIAHLFAENNITMFPFTSGHDVLEATQLVRPSLILLDVVMPSMDGYEVCRRLKDNGNMDHIPIIFLTSRTEPIDIIRGFHSGGADYIVKPFRKEELLSRVKTHLALHDSEESLKDALNAKGQLLDETLKGSIRMLIDILAMTNPETFAQTIRARNLAKKMAVRLGLENAWEIEIGVLLSQLGCAVIPSDIVQKKQAGNKLTSQENCIFNSHPKVAARFISSIPRLEQVAESIQNQFGDYHSKTDPDIISDFIRIVFDYDNRIQAGSTQQQALEEMEKKVGQFNPLLLGALEAEVRRLLDGFVIRTVAFDELKSGMVLADDLHNSSNVILVRRNSELSDVLLEKLKNLRYCGRNYEPVKILEHVT